MRGWTSHSEAANTLNPIAIRMDGVDPPLWTVLRCFACAQCYGRKKGKIGRCSRCGVLATDSTEVVTHAENETELQHEIALANIPECFRKELSEKMVDSKMVSTSLEDDARRLKECLISSASDGIVTPSAVDRALARMNIQMSAGDLIEMGYGQGLLLHLSEDQWQVLE